MLCYFIRHARAAREEGVDARLIRKGIPPARQNPAARQARAPAEGRGDVVPISSREMNKTFIDEESGLRMSLRGSALYRSVFKMKEEKKSPRRVLLGKDRRDDDAAREAHEAYGLSPGVTVQTISLGEQHDGAKPRPPARKGRRKKEA